MIIRGKQVSIKAFAVDEDHGRAAETSAGRRTLGWKHTCAVGAGHYPLGGQGFEARI